MSATFSKFRHLPPEIRLMVWEEALPDARVYEVLDAPNAKQKTPAQEGLMFANMHPEPPPALAGVCRESRYLTLLHYKALTLGRTTKYVDPARDILLLEPYLLVKRFHRTLHYLSQIPLVRDNLRRLALGTSYGLHTGICHPVLSWKVSKNNVGKLLAALAKFVRLKTLILVVHQEFQFEVDYRFPVSDFGVGLAWRHPFATFPPTAPSSSYVSRPQLVHQAYRFKFDIEANISYTPRHSNELLYYPLDMDEDKEDDRKDGWVEDRDPLEPPPDDASGECCDRWPTNDDWRRFRKRFQRALTGAVHVAREEDMGISRRGGVGNDGVDVDENTPLLSGGDLHGTVPPAITADGQLTSAQASTVVEQSDGTGSDDDKPLPVWQIVLLCYARFVEPVTFFSIFPFINKMTQENGHLADADVGFYSGLIESLFSLTQMAVMIFWGKAADRLGRKPVLVISLAGVSMAAAVFGLATTLWEMMLYRCLAGVFAGTIVTLRIMVSEHSTPKTQPRAYSWFAFTGNLGILIGPLIGGMLAEPAKQYPALFGNVQLFIDYPYALSSFAVGLIGASAVLICLLFVEETLPRTAKNNTDHHHADLLKRAPPSTWELIRLPGVGIVLFTYMYLMLLAFAYTAIAPVFWYTPVAAGGLAFTPRQISLVLALNGLAQALWVLLVFPPLHQRLGTNGVLRACGNAYPFFFAVSPLAALLLRAWPGGRAAALAFWAGYPAALALGSGVSMAFTAAQLALNEVAPSPAVLGTLNALALALVSGVRSFAPALFSSLFAVGVRSQWLGGYMIWVLMTAMALGGTTGRRNMKT
ncbi:hypothetical protein P8C59_007446 [Phyllachora maydis]|uniref:Major facilitator superfamily (MFS) profile domain-containing protein n=2 Tax=Phyllachora maydis TaxID=1825666 RepID=A0AAD9I9Q5_9PEZI|nr:hypothetical protein P8C59_007446 [Phyllachora maydis]